MKQSRLLLISGGSLVGRNILAGLAERRGEVELIATNSAPDDGPLFECDRVYLTPTTLGSPQAFRQRIGEIIASEQPDLVIPCRDDDTVFLAALGESQPELAQRLLCGSLAAAQALRDKYLSYEFSQRFGLPFAPSLATPDPAGAEAFAAAHGFPLVAKPRSGNSGRGVFFILNHEQLLQAAAQEHLVLQAYLGNPSDLFAAESEIRSQGLPLFHSSEGLKHSIQILIAPDGSPAGNFCSINVNRGNTSIRLTRSEDEDARLLGERCLLACAEAGWRGPVNIQCQRTPAGELMIYEFNARISGASAARLQMGYDEIGQVIRQFTGQILSPAQVEPGPRVLRHQVDVALPEARIAQLQATGFWQKQAAASPAAAQTASLSAALADQAPQPAVGPHLIGVLPGEGIGPEVVSAALNVLETLESLSERRFTLRQGGLIGTAAERACGQSLSPDVIEFSQAIFAAGGALFCGPGGSRFVYELRARFDLYCKFTPLLPFAVLADCGALRPERVRDVDIVAVRENISGLYFGNWGRSQDEQGELAYHHLSYHVKEVDRILRVALRLAQTRRGKLCVVLKPYGVPSISQFWAERAHALNTDFGVELSVLEVDNAAYQLVTRGQDFDVLVSPNMFGDLLADVGALMLGSRGMSFSGNFGAGIAAYQTGHGAAYDLAGSNRANPLGQILSLAMMLRESFGWPQAAERVEAAIATTLAQGYRTADIAAAGQQVLGTRELTAQVCRNLRAAGAI